VDEGEQSHINITRAQKTGNKANIENLKSWKNKE
jgi:hypothetical protein